jgi:hypothetical protein
MPPLQDPNHRMITESPFYVPGITVEAAKSVVDALHHPIIRSSSQAGRYAISFYMQNGRFMNVRVSIGADARGTYLTLEGTPHKKYYSVDELIELAISQNPRAYEVPAAAPAAAAPAAAAPAAAAPAAGPVDILNGPLPDPYTFRSSPMYREYFRSNATIDNVFEMVADRRSGRHPPNRHPILWADPHVTHDPRTFIISYFSTKGFQYNHNVGEHGRLHPTMNINSSGRGDPITHHAKIYYGLDELTGRYYLQNYEPRGRRFYTLGELIEYYKTFDEHGTMVRMVLEGGAHRNARKSTKRGRRTRRQHRTRKSKSRRSRR